jgi:uncharacterized protein YdeI (YjbR/CyaY-like superfamily)
MTDHPRLEITSLAELDAWLETNGATAGSIWLVTWKKHHPDRHVPYCDVVDVALCHGFVDSLPRKLDDDRSMLRLSPRNPKSAWSKVNRDKVERLKADGRMRPAGLAAVAAAKANGQWEALTSVDALEPPDDLVAAFALHPGAAAAFAGFPKSARRGILEWIVQAKTPATRAKRITETARLAGEGKRANQWRQPTTG